MGIKNKTVVLINDVIIPGEQVETGTEIRYYPMGDEIAESSMTIYLLDPSRVKPQKPLLQ